MKKNAFTRFVATGALMAGLPFVSYAQSPNPPETTLEAPTHAQEEVLALYSDTYTVAEGMPTLVGTEFSEVKIGDNNVWHVKIGSGSDPCYLEFAEPLDLSDYNTFFIDVYAVEQNAFNFRIRLNGASSPNQLQLQVNTGWNRLEFDLNDFNLLSVVPDLTQVTKINFVGEGARTIYIDNVYACKAPHSDMATAPTEAAPDAGRLAADVLPIFTDLFENEIGVTFNKGIQAEKSMVKGFQFTPGTVDKILFVKNGKGGYGGVDFNTAVDVTPYDSIHFDVFPVGTKFDKLQMKLGNVSTAGKIASASNSDAWNPVDISLDDYLNSLNADAEAPDLTNLQEKAFWFCQYQSGGERTFFVDNIYFYKTRTETGPGTGIASLSTQDQVTVSTQGNTVMLSSDVAMESIQVYSLSGQHVMTLQGAGQSAIVSLEAEQAGIYLFNVALANGETVVKKILNM